MTTSDRMKKWAALTATAAGEPCRVGDRARVPAIEILAALLVGAVAGCHGSAPESSPGDRGPVAAVVKKSAPASPASDRQPAPAVVKKSAPASSSSDRDAVEAVARGFLKASKEHDQAGMEAFLTAKARTQFAKSGGTDRTAGLLLGATYQLGEPAIKGDTADIPATLREAGKEQKMGLKLRRVGGKWGVFALSGRVVPDDPQSEIVINFEEPEAIFGQLFGGKPEDLAKAMEKNLKDSFDRATKDMVEGKPESADLAVEALASISRDQFEASWKADVPSKGRPAGEVLKELAKGMGRSLETTAIQDRALARPLAIEVRGLSRHQAIDEVARSAGLAPVYPEPGVSFDPSAGESSVHATMRLSPRHGPRFVAFTGPFLVEMVDVKQAVPYATAVLTLKVTATGLPPIVLNDLEHRPRDTFNVTEVVDAKGRSLVDTDAKTPGGLFTGRTIPGEYERTTRLPLKGLLRDVSAIKTLRCKLRVPLPARVDTIRFDTLAPGQTRKVGDLEVTLKTATRGRTNVNGTPGESQNLSIVLRRDHPDSAKRSEPGQNARPVPPGIAPDRVKLVGHDAKGRPLRTSSLGSFPSDRSSWTFNLTIQGRAAGLVAKVIAVEDVVVYEALLQDIPLASHGSMPERIEPARFPGHESPVAVEFLSIGGSAPFQTAHLRVTNHSDKDIRMLGMKLDYLAPDGRRLGGWDMQDQWGTPWNPGRDPGEPNPILVAKGSKTVFEINPPFLTKGTKTIAVTVRTVGFADAEAWHAPGLKK
jgi:hypothetical protein